MIIGNVGYISLLLHRRDNGFSIDKSNGGGYIPYMKAVLLSFAKNRLCDGKYYFRSAQESIICLCLKMATGN